MPFPHPRFWTPKVVARMSLVAVAVVVPLLAGVEEYERTAPWRARCWLEVEHNQLAAEACSRMSDPRYVDALVSSGAEPADVARARANVPVYQKYAKRAGNLRATCALRALVPWVDIKSDSSGAPQNALFRWLARRL